MTDGGTNFDTNGDGVTDQTGFDTNGDGLIDTWYIDTNRNLVADEYAFDTNRDGRADTWNIDRNEDNVADQTLNDGDGNGFADVAPDVTWTTIGPPDGFELTPSTSSANVNDLFDLASKTNDPERQRQILDIIKIYTDSNNAIIDTWLD